jgi:hypothetical protein
MTTASQISIHALGGPTSILEIGGLRLLTDPTFDAPREYVMGPGRVLAKTAHTALSAAEVGPVDAVLLSHDQHRDNLDISGRDYLGQSRSCSPPPARPTGWAAPPALCPTGSTSTCLGPTGDAPRHPGACPARP